MPASEDKRSLSDLCREAWRIAVLVGILLLTDINKTVIKEIMQNKIGKKGHILDIKLSLTMSKENMHRDGVWQIHWFVTEIIFRQVSVLWTLERKPLMGNRIDFGADSSTISALPLIFGEFNTVCARSGQRKSTTPMRGHEDNQHSVWPGGGLWEAVILREIQSEKRKKFDWRWAGCSTLQFFCPETELQPVRRSERSKRP